MKKLNESKIIECFQKKLGSNRFQNEDVEFFKLGKDNTVLKVDTLVESTDIPSGMSLFDAARKSIVSAVSDFASKGIKPKVCLVSVTLPKDITEKQVIQIAKGLRHGAKEYGFNIIGGDTNQGKEVSISIVLCGNSSSIPKRSGAKIGDKIFVTGNFGYSSAGIHILLKKFKSTGPFFKKATDAVIHPKVHLDFGLKAMRLCNSSMDSSDGLSTTLNHIAKQSKKQLIITHIPTTSEIMEFAKLNQIDYKKIVFDGGEEYEIIFTVSKNNVNQIKKIAKSLKISLIEIGYVKKGNGVFLEEGKIRIKDQGWQHFK